MGMGFFPKSLYKKALAQGIFSQAKAFLFLSMQLLKSQFIVRTVTNYSYRNASITSILDALFAG